MQRVNTLPGDLKSTFNLYQVSGSVAAGHRFARGQILNAMAYDAYSDTKLLLLLLLAQNKDISNGERDSYLGNDSDSCHSKCGIKFYLFVMPPGYGPIILRLHTPWLSVSQPSAPPSQYF